ncbi:MAG TPA: ADP-ribosylation factor-like protein [Candidatus Bathyarchaeia archaeon]|nr:ADP-ribosylation factor-like protein [Candidatus Bathyarchaeia archaeon]
MQIQNQELDMETNKILIAGIDNAGKSSIQDTLRFISTEAALRRAPSRDIEIFNKNFLKKNYVFFIPPGQEDLRINEYHGSMKIEYFSEVSTFIFVIDSSDKERFREAQIELQHSIEDLLELSPECNKFLFFAHKQDLKDASNAIAIQKEILEPLAHLFPGIIKQFKIFETSILFPESIHEPFLKAIASHIGTIKIDFDILADWIREQVSAKIVLITDPHGLLVGESFIGKEESLIYAAYVAKIFSATEEFQEDLVKDGVKIVILEDDDERNYSLISRINCSKNDYLALFIGNPAVHLGMARLINKRGLEKLQEVYYNYQN